MAREEAGAAERKLILGLGNPGQRYRDTRHNLGFWVVEELAKRWDLTLAEQECSTRFASGTRADLATPLTYMNRSGLAARCLVERRSYLPENLLVIYDDVSLPLGKLRLRPGGSPGGHRGMESVVESLRTAAIPRLRLGIAPQASAENEDPAAEPPIDDLAEFVLTPFAEAETEAVANEVQRAAAACECWLVNGNEITMNRFNG